MKSLIGWASPLVLIVVLLVLIIRGDLLSWSPYVIAGQAAGVLLLLSGRLASRGQQFRTAPEAGSGPLVRRGSYRLIRHPIYAGALLFLWASVAGHWSILNGAFAAIVTAAVLVRIDVEEGFLRSTYSEYAAYSRETKRLVPFLF